MCQVAQPKEYINVAVCLFIKQLLLEGLCCAICCMHKLYISCFKFVLSDLWGLIQVRRTHALPQHHQLRFTSARAQQDSKGDESMQADSTVKVQSIAFRPWFSPGNKTVATQESIHLVQSILKHSSGISSCRAPLTGILLQPLI